MLSLYKYDNKFVFTFFILGILIIILPVEILLAILFAILCVTLLYKVIKKPIENIGERLNDIFEKRQSILRQSTGMIKEVKIMNKEDYFTRKFSDIENRNFKEQAYYNFISTVPPLVVELIVVIATLLVIGFVLLYSDDEKLGIAIIGVIATTLFRLMPIFNRQLSYLQMMNLSKDAVDTIGKEVKDIKIILPNVRDKKSEFNFRQKVIFKSFFKYPNSKEDCLKNINFSVKKGQFVGITGFSGSGKTTLISLFSGLLKPSKGEIKVDNLSLDTDKNIHAWHKNIGLASQYFLMDGSITENIAFGSDINNESKKIWKTIKSINLQNFVKKLPNKIDEFIGEDGAWVSGGQRQRLGIARLLFQNPNLMIFDESTSNLDVINERLLINHLIKLKKLFYLLLIESIHYKVVTIF